MVSGFDVTAVACSPGTSANEMAEYGVEKVEFDELLARSDFVSIHAPLTHETEDLFDRDAFTQMKDDVLLIILRVGVLSTKMPCTIRSWKATSEGPDLMCYQRNHQSLLRCLTSTKSS